MLSTFRSFNIWNIVRLSYPNIASTCRHLSDETTSNAEPPQTDEPKKIGGFAKAFEKYTAPVVELPPEPEKYTFASLLRNSSFIDLGDPDGKIVIGEIFHVVEDDLYIDFGWKFHCVCVRPNKRKEEYVRGAKVRIAVRELEMSSRFLGSTTDLTLLEADCKLLGLISSPVRTSFKDSPS